MQRKGFKDRDSVCVITVSEANSSLIEQLLSILFQGLHGKMKILSHSACTSFFLPPAPCSLVLPHLPALAVESLHVQTLLKDNYDFALHALSALHEPIGLPVEAPSILLA